MKASGSTMAPVDTGSVGSSTWRGSWGVSTLMNSQGVSEPFFTSLPSPLTMCVCGEIGWAQITSGRLSATASATACEPSICLRMATLFKGRDRQHFGCGDQALAAASVNSKLRHRMHPAC